MYQQPYSDERLLQAVSALDLLNPRERAVRGKRTGVSYRHYELKRLLMLLRKQAKWFRAATRGKSKPRFETVQSRLEMLVILLIHIGTKVELAEWEVRQFYLGCRSAYMPDREKARKLHPDSLYWKESQERAKFLCFFAKAALEALERGYDGERLSVTDLQAPIKWSLSHFTTLARNLSYTPEQFDARALKIIGERSLKRFARAG